MSRNQAHIDASPDAVFAVLSDPDAFSHWVVGAKRIRSADGDWPEVGAAFHHAVGFGPIEIKDSTTVVECEPGKRLVLRARARPAAVANVHLDLEPADGGTLVTMEEHPVGGVLEQAWNKVLDIGTHYRNAEALRRLKSLAEDRPRG